MEMIETFLEKNPLQDAEDIDSLLELADLVRTLIDANQTAGIIRLLQYTMEHRCYDAFSWCMGLLQEELEKVNKSNA